MASLLAPPDASEIRRLNICPTNGRDAHTANPIAFLAEQAGGRATSGKEDILDIEPTALHQRTPLLVGGREEMKLLADMLEA